MVTVTNGMNVFSVTKGSLGVFSALGFVEVKNSVVVDEPVDEPTVDALDGQDISEEDAIFLDAVEEKPISQWSSADVRKYASINGIDVSKAKNLKEAKAIIKKYFDTVAKEGM